MDIQIITTSHIALYQQIADQIKALIIEGRLKDGDMLPSVRALARELGVSPITTRRAYTDLERDGFVITTPAKGTYVSRRYKERLKELGLMQLDDMLSGAVALAQTLHIPQERLVEIIGVLYQSSPNEPDYIQSLANRYL